MDSEKMNPERLQGYFEQSRQNRIDDARMLPESPVINAILDKYKHLSGKMPDFKPFSEDETSIQVEGITIENRLDRVVAYDGKGVDVEITRDKAGLAEAEQRIRQLADRARGVAGADAIPTADIVLAGLLNNILSVLENDPALPDRIEVIPTVTVSNPFA